MTEWKPIPGWEGRYEVSKEGLIRNVITNKFLYGGEDYDGETIVHLKHGKRRGKKRPKALVRKLFEDQSVETRPGVG